MKKLNQLHLIIAGLLIPSIGFCQTVKAESSTYFSNALFNTLLITIIVLAIVIVAFSSVFKNIADSDYLQNKFTKKDSNSTHTTTTVLIITFLLSAFPMVSQTPELAIAIKKDDGLIGGLDPFTFYFMALVIFAELIILGVMFYQFNFLVKYQEVENGNIKVKESKILKSLSGLKDIEEEASIVLDHEYDGIRELDNDLPPWWKYGFYATIIYAVIYLSYYHILGGDSQKTEFSKEITKAKAEVDEFMKNSASNVDENTVQLLTDAGDLGIGKDVYKTNCAACHGQACEGGVGPNLTDEYWLHGGSLQDVFKSIKYGWVEKGMKSWKEDLSPMQIAQVTSFIRSLKGTNPPNAKPAQGDLYSEGGSTTPIDSTTVVKDTASTSSK